MELLQLRYFLALAETESVTETARRLHISSPSLSGTIGRLEAELGVELFEPAGRGIRLNETGKRLYSRLKPALAEIDLAIREETQRDDVGVVVSIPTAWSDMLIDFSAKRPDILLRTETGNSHRVKSLFSTNEFDFWITAADAAEHADYFDAQELCDHSIVLAVHETHPLAQRQSVSLRELKDEKFLFPRRQYKSYDNHLQLCRGAGFEPKVVAAKPPQTRIEMVFRNEGVSFLECMENKSDLFRGVALVKISDLPPREPCYICMRKGRRLSPNAQTFLDFALNYYRKD